MLVVVTYPGRKRQRGSAASKFEGHTGAVCGLKVSEISLKYISSRGSEYQVIGGGGGRGDLLLFNATFIFITRNLGPCYYTRVQKIS